jgi:hypothetical protein
MMETKRAGEGKSRQKTTKPKPETKTPNPKTQPTPSRAESTGMASLQQNFGNRAVQRLIAQRSGPGPIGEDRQVNEHIQKNIERERGHGQTLPEGTQQQMGQALGEDLSEVRVHTDAPAHQLSQNLQAKAFTTGNDVFFGEGEYNPHSSAGQELLGHELTHVVQQREGRVDLGGKGMQVNEPDDTYEHEADRVAKQAIGAEVDAHAGDMGGMNRTESSVQRQDQVEEDILQKPLQRQEEELQMKPLQRQEEEEVQMMPVQRQEEEEEVQMAVQRQEEEEEVQMTVQRQEEEEEVQMKPLQRQDNPDDVLEKPDQSK